MVPDPNSRLPLYKICDEFTTPLVAILFIDSRIPTNRRKKVVCACPVSYPRSLLILNSISPHPPSRPTINPPPIPRPFPDLVTQIDEEEENEVWEVLVSSDQNSWKTVAQESLPSSIVRKTSLSALESQVRNQLSSEMQKVCRWNIVFCFARARLGACYY